MRSRTSLAALTLIALLAACGSTGRSADPPSTAGRRPPGSSDGGHTGTVDAGGEGADGFEGEGWIGGEPEWAAAGRGGAAMGGATMDGAAAMPAAEASAATTVGVGAGSDGLPAEPPTPGGPTPVSPSEVGLRAGSVDDNADFGAYLEYLARIKDVGVTTRDFDPTGRIVVTVTGTSGLPVDGIEVGVSSGGIPVTTIRTTADGTARFLPALYGAAGAQSFTFEAGGASGEAAPGGAVALAADAPGGAVAPVAVDVLFLLDATGSMGDEIDRLKTTIDSVAERIAGLDSKPDVHFAMTLYRDLGDSFVTTTFDFTGDVQSFRSAIDDVVADGGGDYPEAMDEGLADAMAVPSWRDPASTVQLVFLVADAPPQVQRTVQTPYPASVVEAIARGVKIIPIASSESDDQAEAVFRQIAEATGGRFVFLSYGAGGAATGAHTDIESIDYEELSLDDLIVRLVTEELAALTGTPTPDPVPDTVVTTPPTNPPGQEANGR